MTRDRSTGLRLAIVGFKLVSGTAELVTGAALVVVPRGVLSFLINFAAAQELREDPTDRLALLVQHHLPGLLGTKGRIALALIILAMLKLIGAVGLLRRKAWGYYLLLILMTLLVPFDVIQAVNRHTVSSVGIAILNLIVLAALLFLRQRMVSAEKS